MHRRESAVSRSCCCCPPVPKPLLPTSAAGAGREEKPCPPLLQRRRLLATSLLPVEEEVPRGRSAGHTGCAPRRPGRAAGSARPRPRSCAFRTGEPEARGAHAGDHGDGPRCRACTQPAGRVPRPRHLTPSRFLRTLLSLGRKPSAASAQPRGSERKGRAEKPPASLGPADAEDRMRLRRHRRPRASAASREARLARRRADPVQGAEPGL